MFSNSFTVISHNLRLKSSEADISVLSSLRNSNSRTESKWDTKLNLIDKERFSAATFGSAIISSY